MTIKPTSDAVAVTGAAWRDYTSAPLSFDGGVISINRDGSGYFCADAAEVDWETDDESGKEHIVAKFSAGEAQEIRDHLNKYFPLASTRPMTEDVAGLVERLRAIWPKIPAGPVTTMQRDLIHEAADALTALSAKTEAGESEVERLREALEALRLQALQSDLNDPANEWGWEALQLANAALKGSRHE